MSSIILLGAPGSGKGTLAQQLKTKLNIPHISTGDMFREAVKGNTPMGVKASSYMKDGHLVPDDITIGVVDERFTKEDVKKGFILDGFPRTIPQAEAFDSIIKNKGLKIDAVILLDVDQGLIVRRITGRRSCPSCGNVYHIETVKPKVEGICDSCSTKLIQRKDDTEEVVKERLETYEKQTAPLIDFYSAKKILLKIDASRSPNYMMQQLEVLGF
jgi:adenylate kinase